MKNASKLFFSSFLLLFLVGCVQNSETESVVTNNNKTNEVITNENTQNGPDCFTSPDIPASETIIFSDATHGISLEVPFNPKWSIAGCTPLAPFEQIENGVGFGPFNVWGYRLYTLKILPKLSTEKTKENIKQNQYQEEVTFKEHKLNGISMLEHFPSSPGKCPGSTLIVFGEKNNFELSSPCVFPQGGIENEPIVKSIRLLSD